MRLNFTKTSLLLLTIFTLCFVGIYISLHSTKLLTNQHDIKKGKEFLTAKELTDDYLQKKRERKLSGQAKSDSPDEYSKYHFAIRTRENESAPGYRMNYKMTELNKAYNSKAFKNKRTQQLDWVERGPANVPGRTRGVIVFSDNPDTWLAGAVGGGIWKTTDGGDTWIPKTDDFPSLAVTTLAYCESSPNIVYAGTGEYIASAATAIVGDGIYKSTDKGETWEQLTATVQNSKFRSVNRLIVDPNDANIIVACTSENTWDSDEASYILKSIDGGATWNEVHTSADAVMQIIADPSDFNIQYAGVLGAGVLKSTDGGDTWTDSSVGLRPQGRVELAVSPVNTSRLFASVEGGITATGSDLYISDDAGANWSIILEANDGDEVNFLGGQGWYDNTIACDPYNADIVYYGGVNLWRTIMQDGEQSGILTSVGVDEEGTTEFLDVINFGGAYFRGGMDLGETLEESRFTTVEIRFGEGSQLAHRFTIPAGQGPGVPATSYSYNDYVEVPFTVWDTETDQQLMVSFRDQQDDGIFNLIEAYTEEGDEINHSREYLYVHALPYEETANSSIATIGGHEFDQMYFFWPVLAAGGTWDPDKLPVSTLRVNYSRTDVVQRFGLTTDVTDAYVQYSGKNSVWQSSQEYPFHPDQHNIIMIPVDEAAKTYKILAANDGGLFLSNIGTAPGTQDNDWTIKGLSYNTTQFYGADKKPGVNEYGGGSQDNGTWMTASGESANKDSYYNFVIGGDGFEVLWNYADGNKFIGGSQNNNFYRTLDGGETFSRATSGLTGSSPFISKLASSNANPDIIFTVTSTGVFRSEDFGGSWTATPIESGWGSGSLLNVEVSLANPDIVWAGLGMGSEINFHVSTDNGLSFSGVSNYDAVQLGSSSGLATHPIDDSTAYALFSFADSPKILRTTDLGKTWEDISGFGLNAESSNGFPDVAVYSLLVMPHEPNVIWAGTEIGIFESTDNGQTWAFANNGMPAASIWQMKIVDDQIVVATHGRGIWSVTIPDIPEITLVPSIRGLGTSVQGELAVDLSLRAAYDSSFVYVNDEKAAELGGNSSNVDAIYNISGLPVGDSLGVIINSYKNGKVYKSNTKSVELIEVNDIQMSYANDFNAGSTDFAGGEGNTFFISKFTGFDNFAIHTKHNYEEGIAYGGSVEYIYQLRTPVVIAENDASFRYRDIAIIEPGEDGSVYGETGFYDYVVVEGSSDGVNWTEIREGYDATYNSKWLDAYSSQSEGDASMFVDQVVDLQNTFNANDTVFFRFRLYSDPYSAGYGWVIDDLYIQELPTSTEARSDDLTMNMKLFPNPATGGNEMTAQFTSSQVGEGNLLIIDSRGTIVRNESLPIATGTNDIKINTDDLDCGLYIMSIKTNNTEKSVRFIIQ